MHTLNRRLFRSAVRSLFLGMALGAGFFPTWAACAPQERAVRVVPLSGAPLAMRAGLGAGLPGTGSIPPVQPFRRPAQPASSELAALAPFLGAAASDQDAAAPALGALAGPAAAAAKLASASPDAGLGGLPQAPADAAGAPAFEALEDSTAKGKTWLVVGTRPSRGFILEEAVRIAKQLGLNLVLLDSPENRRHSAGLVPDSNFIPASIDQRDDASIKEIVLKVAAFNQKTKIDVVTAYRSHHAKLTGRIVDETKAVGVSGKAVSTADDKAKTREKLNAIPELQVPARRIRNAAEARQMFRDFNGGKFVMKTIHGENSRFITLGLDSEEAVANAFTQTDAAVKSYAKQAEASSTIFNRAPGILMERQLEKSPGTHESSVEIVMQAGRAAFAIASDTHGIGPRGEFAGGSLTFPSQQSPAVLQAFVIAAVKAAEAIGIHSGNVRVDVMMTPEGARVIEVNPYLGGAAIWKAVKLLTDISLIEWDIRSHLRLRLPTAPLPNGVVDYRFAASQHTGRIEGIDGVEAAKQTPGVRHLQLLAGAGDRIAAPDSNSFEEFAEIMGFGPTLDEARANSVAGLGKLKVRIWPEAQLTEEPGDFMQPETPPADSDIASVLDEARGKDSIYDANRDIELYYERVKARLSGDQLGALLRGLRLHSKNAKGAVYDPTHQYSLDKTRDRIVDSYLRLNAPALTPRHAAEFAVHLNPMIQNFRIGAYYQRNSAALSWNDVGTLLSGLSDGKNGDVVHWGANSRSSTYFRILDTHLNVAELTPARAISLIKGLPRSPEYGWQVNYLIEKYYQRNRKRLTLNQIRALFARLARSSNGSNNARDTGDRILIDWQQLHHKNKPVWVFDTWRSLQKQWPWSGRPPAK